MARRSISPAWDRARRQGSLRRAGATGHPRGASCSRGSRHGCAPVVTPAAALISATSSVVATSNQYQQFVWPPYRTESSTPHHLPLSGFPRKAQLFVSRAGRRQNDCWILCTYAYEADAGRRALRPTVLLCDEAIFFVYAAARDTGTCYGRARLRAEARMKWMRASPTL